jgi:acyl transferase domain-containing protein
MGTAHEARIAIIGMACRFPGANSPRVFWQNLVDGRSAFGEVPADRWDPQMFTDPHARAVDKAYSTRLASLSDIRSFAPAFYGITPKRARVMDPQQRLLLDCAREAIEDAGYARRPLPSATTGVYVGVSVSEHKDIVTSRLHTPQAMNGQYGQSSDREAASPLIDRVPAFHAYTMVGQLLNMCAANI